MKSLIVGGMADHYSTAIALLDEVETKRADLLDEYHEAARPAVISQLHQDIGAALKLAAIHAQLALAGAAQDIRAAIEVRQ
jgi:hypothetical protein